MIDRKKKTIMYYQDWCRAAEENDYIAMSDIYCDIKNFIYGEKFPHSVYFSRLKNSRMQLPSGLLSRISEKQLDALLYKQKGYLEIYQNPLVLDATQYRYLSKYFMTTHKTVAIDDDNGILFDNAIKRVLKVTDNNILKITVSEEITVARFDAEALFKRWGDI